MGIHFGNLQKMRHVITFTLSPFEQRAFPNYFSKGPLNVWRRISTQFFRVLPGVFVTIGVYVWANEDYERRQRKNPADYENDQ